MEKSNVIYPERARAIYSKVKKAAAAQGYRGVISPKTIRAEVYLENGKTEFILQLRDNAPKLASGANREMRLKEQDVFVVTDMRLSALLETIAGPVGHERVHTFNSAIPFADEVGGFQNSHLAILWNSFLYMRVGDSVYLDEYSLSECYAARTQQETASLKSERLPGDGFIPMTPQFIIRGNDNNDLRLKIPGNSVNHKIQYNANSKVVAVLEFKGFIVTGAAQQNLNLQFEG